jgi:hypothetical protein
MNTNNPVVLLSFINTKLRDSYKSLDELCEDLEVNKQEIIEKLKIINYFYDEKTNQFK